MSADKSSPLVPDYLIYSLVFGDWSDPVPLYEVEGLGVVGLLIPICKHRPTFLETEVRSGSAFCTPGMCPFSGV